MATNAYKRLDELRKHAGFTSIESLAKSMGYKGASSIQRYLSPGMDELPLDMAIKFSKVLAGKGDPPVSRNEVLELAKEELSAVEQYVKGNSSYVGDATTLVQSGVDIEKREGAMVEKMLVSILESLGAVKDHLKDLERAVNAMQQQSPSADPRKARRT
jgi:hypothetical protein